MDHAFALFVAELTYSILTTTYTQKIGEKIATDVPTFIIHWNIKIDASTLSIGLNVALAVVLYN